jgi:prepilin-type N-terminal cleavage/methylation domain-containing protein
MKARHNFTLIELLVVIGIIAVLAGLLLPTLNMMMEKAKITKARTEIKALEIAIKQYESTYSFLPVAPAATEGTVNAEGDIVLRADGYNHLIADLTCTNLPSASPTRTGNTRNMRFLEIKNPGAFIDPWDHRYVVVLDTSYNSQIGKAIIPGVYDPSTPEFIYSSAVVVSMGPDGYVNPTPTGYSAPSPAAMSYNKDNIYPFETNWDETNGHSLR